MNFAGLRVAITGGARGTGRLIAEPFAERGAQIFLSARDLTAAEHVAHAIRQRGPGRADAFRCDLAVADSVRAVAAALADRTTYLDVLINNGAPYIEGDDLGDISDDKIESVMRAGPAPRC